MSHTENDVNSRAKTIFLWAFGASLAVHGVAYASLVSRTPDVPAPVSISTVSFEVDAPPPVEPQAPPNLPEAPAAHSVTPAPAAARVAKPEPPTPTPAQTNPAGSPTLDLSGVTLTNDTGDGFALPTGDGSALHGLIGTGGNRAAPASSALARRLRTSEAPALVPLRDLSEHPRPPALEDLLRANYPEEARQRGLRGNASVRARIDSDGVVRAARVVVESAAGFGLACQRTVIGSRWSPPRAQNGDAVATEIVYTCHFEVD
jgi:TonB family protein